MRNAFASVELVEPFFDLRQEHEALDRVVHRRVGRVFPNGLDHPIPVDSLWHLLTMHSGEVEFASWTGETPITVRWTLGEAVPQRLWAELKVPGATAS